MAKKAVAAGRCSIRLACQAFSISETCYRYRAKLKHEEAVIADWLVRLTHNQRNWGFGLCYLYLRNVKGFRWNHKRVWRVYRAMGLNQKRRTKKRLPDRERQPLEVSAEMNHTWSFDFMSDALYSGRRFRCLNIIDEGTREALGDVPDTSLSAARVVRELKQIGSVRGLPERIRIDNGTELAYIQPGKPNQNAYIERFNRSFRDERLDP